MGDEERKLLLKMMLKDMMHIKIRIRILMSQKAKGMKTDEFGEDIDESIKELKEELQMNFAKQTKSQVKEPKMEMNLCQELWHIQIQISTWKN